MPPKTTQDKKENKDEIDYSVDDMDQEDNEVLNDQEPDILIDERQSFKERYEYKPALIKEIVFLHPNNRLTSECMTKFEYAEVISIRAKQIENGGICFTDVSNLTDPREMAIKEITEKQCPITVIRMLTDVIGERWNINEMAIPYDN
jgi:hypothetical protein